MAAGAAAAAAIQAGLAAGMIIRVEAAEVMTILQRQEKPLVVQSTTGFFSTKYQYLTSYRGLAFYTLASHPIQLPDSIELINAKSIWVPG